MFGTMRRFCRFQPDRREPRFILVSPQSRAWSLHAAREDIDEVWRMSCTLTIRYYLRLPTSENNKERRASQDGNPMSKTGLYSFGVVLRGDFSLFLCLSILAHHMLQPAVHSGVAECLRRRETKRGRTGHGRNGSCGMKCVTAIPYGRLTSGGPILRMSGAEYQFM